jgi:hypothetical protein
MKARLTGRAGTKNKEQRTKTKDKNERHAFGLTRDADKSYVPRWRHSRQANYCKV